MKQYITYRVIEYTDRSVQAFKITTTGYLWWAKEHTEILYDGYQPKCASEAIEKEITKRRPKEVKGCVSYDRRGWPMFRRTF